MAVSAGGAGMREVFGEASLDEDQFHRVEGCRVRHKNYKVLQN
jgi:hypothetical protein